MCWIVLDGWSINSHQILEEHSRIQAYKPDHVAYNGKVMILSV